MKIQSILGITPDVKKETDDRLILSVGQKDYSKMLEEKGVTKEIMKTIRQAKRDVAYETVKATLPLAIDLQKVVETKLGTGAESQIIVTQLKKEVRVPKTGELKTVYAPFQIRHNVPTPMDEGFKTLQEEMAKKAEKAESKVKK